MLETTRAMKSRRTGGSSSGAVGSKHKYFMQEGGGIGMNSLQGHGRNKASTYDTSVTVTSAGAGRSEKDFRKTDENSDNGILPTQGNNIGVHTIQPAGISL